MLINKKTTHTKRFSFLRKTSPLISIILLNWNRSDLLRTTLLALLANTKMPFELFVIDNGSSDNSPQWLQLIAPYYKNIHLILLKENLGGEALNLAIEKTKGEFIFFCENDIQALPDWDLKILEPFLIFPDLGQVSPFSPFPQKEIGEIWSEKPYVKVKKYDYELFLSTQNVGTSCMVRREVLTKGVKWSSIRNGNIRFPADGYFSDLITRAGYKIAWSNEYLFLNLGHNKIFWDQDRSYYEKNWNEKKQLNIDGLNYIAEIEKKSIDKPYVEQIKILKHEINILSQMAQNSIYSGGFSKPKTMLFLNTGSGYTSEQFEIDTIDLNSTTSVLNEVNCTFNVSDFRTIKELRWDPLEGFHLEVQLLEILLNTKSGEVILVDLKKIKHNGARRFNLLSSEVLKITFLNTDPMIMFTVPTELNSELKTVSIKANLKII